MKKPFLCICQVDEIASGFGTTSHLPTEISELQGFSDNHAAEVRTASFDRLVEAARANEKWTERNFVDVVAWLRDNADASSSNSGDNAAAEDFELNLEISRPGSVTVGEQVWDSPNEVLPLFFQSIIVFIKKNKMLSFHDP